LVVGFRLGGSGFFTTVLDLDVSVVFFVGVLTPDATRVECLGLRWTTVFGPAASAIEPSDRTATNTRSSFWSVLRVIFSSFGRVVIERKDSAWTAVSPLF
jgi:hypothetical protein